ncbi:MAG: GNAT family N-acetyltransferase [Clostridia bacterium]|nr:GNAT family N-acetyltransferase [Clostridia bacterium]
MQVMHIRMAEAGDARALLDIYAPYVEKTAITFELEVPGLEEFGRRMIQTMKRYPFLVAEENGEILGYAYTGPFKERAAYDWAVETSIYVKMGKTKSGIGRSLYTSLEDASRKQHVLNLNACIASPVVEDEYLTRNSIQFHEHFGYSMVGVFHLCGFKFGRWYDMVWMEKMIGQHTDSPDKVMAFKGPFFQQVE